MDVTIKLYAKNYPYRLIFKSVRLKMAKNMLVNVCKTVYTIVNAYSGFVTLFLHMWVGVSRATTRYWKSGKYLTKCVLV